MQYLLVQQSSKVIRQQIWELSSAFKKLPAWLITFVFTSLPNKNINTTYNQ